MREIFCAEMVKAFEKKPFVFLTGDLGFRALEPLQEKMQDHFINVGISEQNMISVAAGIAKTGLQVFCYSIAPFAFARPFEQIRNDVCLHSLPVTIVGNGGGYGYGVMGATHHAIEDYGALLTLQNMHAFIPAFDEDIAAIIQRISYLKKPSYLRLGLAKKSEEISYASWRKILDGDLGVLIICGSIASNILHDFKDEDKSMRPSIWLVCELPLLEDFPAELTKEIKNLSKVCVLEEHVAQGGIGQEIAKKILTKNIALNYFSHLHAQGYVSGFYGSQQFHRVESGLTKESVINQFSKAA
ncbi:MAG: transketolase [Proteobacteria bacterium]|nr:transketolase [Pseudomonadota bacterium]